ncbi:hypothetical protein [Jatrophihabitans sp.]|uniref:hypothetical protein n=1 Tax=Jatrophihabitans sp. TaxID=1932789 RepID=UPI0030C771A9|nr:hypothetical protein [Jatrophihabitans sp.]
MTVRPLRRAAAAALLALALAAALAACTPSNPTITTSSTSTSIVKTTIPPTGNTGPVSTAKVTEKTASSCPYISLDAAHNDAGYRLERITRLSQDGKLVGCRFYPLEHPNAQCDAVCLAGEKLPPGNVPGVDILSTKYTNANNASNAFIKLAEAGTDYQREEIAPGNTGLCFRTTVWTKDNGRDWACTFSKGATMVVIRTFVTDPALNVVEIAKAIYPKF